MVALASAPPYRFSHDPARSPARPAPPAHRSLPRAASGFADLESGGSAPRSLPTATLTGIELLRELVEAGARWRWKGEPPDDVRRQIEKEARHVELLTAYEVFGFLEPPGSAWRLEDRRAARLYQDYATFVQSGGAQGAQGSDPELAQP